MSDLHVRGVSLQRSGRTVLDAVDVSFAAGRLTAVIGPNGAGKSSLLAVAGGLLVPTMGAVMLDDVALADLPRRTVARRRAFLPQNPRVEWPISVERVVALGLAAHLPAFGSLPPQWQPRIDEALRRHDLTGLRDRAATRLSGGELARVMLARATVAEPDILLVDEPTTGLDPRHVRDAGRQLREIAAAGCAVVVALHDLDLALAIADDVVAMKEGRVVGAGPMTSTFTQSLLTALYAVGAIVHRDAHGATVRFTDDVSGTLC